MDTFDFKAFDDAIAADEKEGYVLTDNTRETSASLKAVDLGHNEPQNDTITGKTLDAFVAKQPLTLVKFVKFRKTDIRENEGSTFDKPKNSKTVTIRGHFLTTKNVVKECNVSKAVYEQLKAIGVSKPFVMSGNFKGIDSRGRKNANGEPIANVYWVSPTTCKLAVKGDDNKPDNTLTAEQLAKIAEIEASLEFDATEKATLIAAIKA